MLDSGLTYSPGPSVRWVTTPSIGLRNRPLLEHRLGAAQFDLRHSLVEHRQREFLLGDVVVGLSVLHILGACDMQLLQTLLAGHHSALLREDRLLGFDLRRALGARLIVGDRCLLDRGLEVRDDLSALDRVSAIRLDVGENAGDGASELDRQRRLEHAIECRRMRRGDPGKSRGETERDDPYRAQPKPVVKVEAKGTVRGLHGCLLGARERDFRRPGLFLIRTCP